MAGERNRPAWRWWLCCLALDLHWRTGWAWSLRLFGWCVLPEWVATDAEIAEARHG